jgi:hypothetical protein
MTVVKLRSALAEIKSLLSTDTDFLRPLVRVVLQEVMEGEMTEALGAGKSERVEGRLGYRSGHYSPPWIKGQSRGRGCAQKMSVPQVSQMSAWGSGGKRLPSHAAPQSTVRSPDLTPLDKVSSEGIAN